jgi:hypothetical protein
MDDVTRRTRSKSSASVEAYVRAARDAAAHDKLVERANNTINAKLEADAMAGMTFQEYQQADAERDAWEISKVRQEMAQREAERAEEATLLEGATQTAEDWAEVQRRRDAEAVRALLDQPSDETFTMRRTEDGLLHDD